MTNEDVTRGLASGSSGSVESWMGPLAMSESLESQVELGGGIRFLNRRVTGSVLWNDDLAIMQ